MTGRPILTAAEMRTAEAAAVAAGCSERTLMERAGSAAAEAIRRYTGRLPALVLCGPGNNGGDGYVIARLLQEAGIRVRVAALGEPRTEAARAARQAWSGEVEDVMAATPARLLVDALFGTGLARPLDAALSKRLGALAAAAKIRAAIDLPSGCATDDGSILSPVADFDLTVTFASLKPSHLLQPAARHMGRIVVADIGVEAQTRTIEIARPKLRTPGPEDHKYTRGYVLVVGGAMHGAAALAAGAAGRAGAGYVVLVGDGADVPKSVIRVSPDRLEEMLADKRVGSVVVGPGLGRDMPAWEMLAKAAHQPHPTILDGDALWLIGEMGIPYRRKEGLIATPHCGEFRHMFGDGGSKIEAAREAAERTGMTVVYKGPDTVVAAPDGRAAVASASAHWLATAGTGDVLSGVIATMTAQGLPNFEAACAGVWLHGRAAELAGPGLIADDLLGHLPAALAECL